MRRRIDEGQLPSQNLGQRRIALGPIGREGGQHGGDAIRRQSPVAEGPRDVRMGGEHPVLEPLGVLPGLCREQLGVQRVRVALAFR